MKSMATVLKGHAFSAGVIGNIQLLKKPSQCFAILERVTWNKSHKLSNIVKIMYVVLYHLGFRKYPGSCDLDQK